MNEHHISELLHNQFATGLRNTKLLFHQFERPPQGGPIPPYLVLASGTATVNGNRFDALEALVARDETTLHIEALENTEIVLIVTA